VWHQEPDPFAMQPQYEPSLLRQLKTVMSSTAMLAILKRDWKYPKRRGLILKDCQVVRVYPREGKEFVLEYEMHFLDENGERVERVFGELVGEQAQERCGEVIDQLKKMERNQLSRTAPIDQITCLPDLGLILRLSGLDEKLRGLRHTRKRSVIRRFASQYLSLDGGEVTNCQIDILGHRLGKRCVIRYRLKSLDPKTGRRVRHSRRSLIGKVYKFREDRGRQVFKVMRSLWKQGFSNHDDDGIRIPKPLAYFPEWQLLLMEDALGASPASLEESRIEPVVEAAGRVLAKLHRCPLKVPGRHTVEDELALLRGWVAVVSQVHPGSKTALENAFNKVQVALDRCRSFKRTLVHRDFYEKQVLVDGHEAILIDFDTLCLSDPAIDVGNFLAHLRLAGWQRQEDFKHLEHSFIRAYRPRLSQDFTNRIEAYTNSSLLRLACLYSLWPQWTHLAEPLLGDMT